MKYLTLLAVTLFLCACTNEVEDKKTPRQDLTKPDLTVDKTTLVDIQGNIYTEYYPGGKNIKFQGPQDEEKKRHGKWVYLAPDGKELSMTMYKHGMKHGHSIVKYPNGALHYIGEYSNNQKIGLWKSYHKSGNIIEEKDYGQLKN